MALRAGTGRGGDCRFIDLPARPGLASALGLPFLAFPEAERSSRAAWSYLMAHDGLSDEHVLPIAAVHEAASVLVLRDGPVVLVEEIAGLSLAVSSTAVGSLFESLGAHVLAAPRWAGEAPFDAGEVDGIVLPWAEAGRLMQAPSRHLTSLGGDRALGGGAFLFALDLSTYESLPEPVRASIAALSGRDVSAAAGRALDRAGAAAREAMAGRSARIDEARIGALRKTGDDLRQNWASESEAAEEALAAVQDLMGWPDP